MPKGPAFSYMYLHATSANLKGKAQFPSAKPLRGGRNPHALLDPALWSQQSRQSINTRQPMPQRERVSEAPHRPRIVRPCAQPPPTVYLDDPGQWSFGLEWSSSGTPVYVYQF